METGAPSTDTAAYTSQQLLLKVDKLGFKPRMKGIQQLPGVIFQSMIVKF